MELPFGKILVYVLSFACYLYSGYGSGLLNNLRDAVQTAESVFGDMFKNVFSMANNMKSFNDVFSASINEHCIFECPNKEVVPIANKNHKPTANGCGSVGLRINTEYLPEMTKCCNAHDICYDVCRNEKEVCDRQFQNCLYRYCDTLNKLGDTPAKACQSFAKLLYTGTEALGCKFYLDAQSRACYCAPEPKQRKKDYKFTKGADL